MGKFKTSMEKIRLISDLENNFYPSLQKSLRKYIYQEQCNLSVKKDISDKDPDKDLPIHKNSYKTQ